MTSLKKSASTSNCDYRQLGMQYQMDGTFDPRPKRGPDVKIIIQSLKLLPIKEQGEKVSRAIACNPAKMFKSSIQHANDSGSMDTSLEYKPLFSHEIKSRLSQRRKMPFVDELREKLKENQNNSPKTGLGNKVDRNGTPSKLPFMNRKNLPETPASANHSLKTDIKTPTFCEKYFDLLPLTGKKMPASSTPFRPKQDNDINCNNNNNCDKALNQMTPAADVKPLVKCFSLTRASCRRMASFRRTAPKQDCVSDILESNSPNFERRSLFTSSFNGRSNRSSIVSTNEISPLQRQKNIRTKNSKLLNFFRSSKTINETTPASCHESDLTKTCNNLSRLLEKSGPNVDDLGCTPLLTVDNVDYHANNFDEKNDCDKTIGWDNKFEFSYICEPSTSDIDEDDELSYFPSTNCRKKLPFIPFIKVTAPSIDMCDSIIKYNINSSPFRRSASDPALIRLATNYNRHNIEAIDASHNNNKNINESNSTKSNIVSDFSILSLIINFFRVQI